MEFGQREALAVNENIGALRRAKGVILGVGDQVAEVCGVLMHGHDYIPMFFARG
jgi:hypothetical protein